MPQIVFEGGSDDLIEVEGPVATDEGVIDGEEFDTCAQPEAGEQDDIGAIMARFEVQAPTGEGLRVTAIYNGCWAFAAGHRGGDERNPWPDWPVSVKAASGRGSDHSTALVIDAPAGAMVRKV